MDDRFVLLAEYYDDLQLELVRSMLFDEDIAVELEKEAPRGMGHRDSVPTRLLVAPKDLKRARRLIRRGIEPFQPDLTDGAFGF